MATVLVKNNPSIIRAWYFYDWANSAFSLTIVSAIFPAYYSSISKGEDGLGVVQFLGLFQLSNSVLFSYAISFAFLIAAILSPILSSMADYTGRKKAFLQFFTVLGSLNCFALFFFSMDTFSLGVINFTIALISFSSSLVMYNSFLPDIASDDKMDSISAKGFMFGYIGSIILLIINLLPILQPAWFGNISGGLASRIAFASVGLWWIGFAQITFAKLPSYTHPPKGTQFSFEQISQGFADLRLVLKEALQFLAMKRFLMAYFFFTMGVQTIMYVAALFGEKVLNLPSSALIITILLLQIVAIGGAFLTSKLSEQFGNKPILIALTLCWIGICVAAWQVQNETQFYILAALVGTIMGGSQSLARSTFSKLIPDESLQTTSYFSFYDFTEKIGIVLGTASYGLIETLTGSMRNSVLGLIGFFSIALFAFISLPVVSAIKAKGKN